MPETLNGFVERVTYHNPENGFAVLRVKVKGRVDLVSLVGITTSVTAGEHVEASGRWVIDRQHGQQFKADELKTTHPASAEGIEKYLASGAIRSIGPKIADCIAVFSLEKLEAFPIDVWIRRALAEWYFADRKKPTDRVMLEWAQNHFGRYGGYAKQYLFHGQRLRKKAD